ncbi:MAG: FimB/Mfa2 family fimbrial subunit [Muribaculaceae bacterium]|nr:FimB/Mfa2 family fimbrial subunit [Muribaculaceae bacterium]
MNYKTFLALATSVLTLSSCNNPVFDDEGDCEVHYYLRFVYDMNLKWADAFPSEVNSVNLYAFNSNGIFVKEFLGRGDALSQAGYEMELDLDPGTYQLVAWCGLDNDGKEMESFTVPTPEPGVTTLDELTCTLNTLSNSQYPVYSDSRLYFMYHGNMEVELPDSQDGSSYYYTMALTKDTNHIRIILQQLSAEDMEPDRFGFRITDANGELAYNNDLLGDTKVNYLEWAKGSALAGVSKKDIVGTSELVYVNGVYADLSVSRIMADHKNEFLLSVYDSKKGDDIIVDIPVIQYALLSKDYYELAYNHVMTDQEFLDREDEYVLTFFLDENIKWVSTSILIHSWRIVLDEYGLQ